MNTNKKGDIGLANVILDVTNKGYFLFLPFSDTTHVDLIISNNNMDLFKLQIKYISVDKNGVLNIFTSNVVNGKRIPIKLNQIDIWAIFCPQTNQIYYINSQELITCKNICLRINEPKQIQKGIRYAKDYLDIEKALTFTIKQ